MYHAGLGIPCLLHWQDQYENYAYCQYKKQLFIHITYSLQSLCGKFFLAADSVCLNSKTVHILVNASLKKCDKLRMILFYNCSAINDKNNIGFVMNEKRI